MIVVAMLTNANAYAQTAVVRARLEHADMVGIPRGEVVFDAYFTRTFHIGTALHGAIKDHTIRDVVWSAQPRTGRDYYLLIDSSRGVAQIVDWSLAAQGLCINRKALRKYLDDTAVDTLLHKYPCAE